jgi:ubiquinone/menaquinone biosynthesis C-methylase UbiE
MTLERILETEVLDTYEEARDYDAMDHSEVNRRFVDDLLAVGDLGTDVLDLCTGTARIPIELCRRFAECRVMAADLSAYMLDLARLNIEIAGQIQRIQLEQADAKRLPYADAYFDVVLSNGSLHHIPEPLVVLREVVRVLRPGGVFFLRDLVRPDSAEAVTALVATYAGEANDRQQAKFADSLRASLTLAEIRELIERLGYDPQTVQMTSDRHWTWTARKPGAISGEGSPA